MPEGAHFVQPTFGRWGAGDAALGSPEAGSSGSRAEAPLGSGSRWSWVVKAGT